MNDWSGSDRSLVARLARLPKAERREALGILGDAAVAALGTDWQATARDEQLYPPGDQLIWLLLAGRGFGKTRTGAEWVRSIAETVEGARIAIVGATMADARAVMVEGESGLLAVGDEEFRPRFYPARRLLKWQATGAMAVLYSADRPDQLRGPQHHAAWGDELAKWPAAAEVIANLRLGLRLGRHPRMLLTTTPRPLPVLKALMRDPDCVVTRGSTRANRSFLPTAFLDAVEAAYGGTRLGRQELGGELIEDAEGALWTRAMIEACRIPADAARTYRRIVVGVDPPAGEGASAAACGIVVAGLWGEVAVVIDDASVQGLAPEGWAAAVVAAAERHGADRVIAEVNNGGAMVTSVLRAVDSALPVKAVRASRGKAARAEPVAALYEAGKVWHAGVFPPLEDEMCGLIMGGGYVGPGGSPDRADALVWALTELMLQKRSEPGVRRV